MSENFRVPAVRICDFFAEQARVLADSVWRMEEAQKSLDNAKRNLTKFIPGSEVESLVNSLRKPRYECQKCQKVYLTEDFNHETGICRYCGADND